MITSITESLVKYPLQEAQDCIRNYITNARSSGIADENIIRAYTVKAKDVIDVLGITATEGGEIGSKYSYFRAYIGQEREIEKPDNFTFKLFLVPVIETEKGEFIDLIPRDANGDLFVYDFNTPCPNSCDFASRLYIK